MAEKRNIEGQCLCGGVTIAAVVDAPTLAACHCSMCQRQNSGPYISVMTDQSATKAAGPVKIFRSSDWAERAFCAECGSTIWYSTVHDGARYLSAGLFENAGGASLELEYYADNCPQGYALAGDHKRMTKAETIAFFTSEMEKGG